MTARARTETLLAVLLGLVLLAAASAFGSKSAAEADLRTSTYLDGRTGARALHLLLEDVGLRPVRAVEPPSADAPTDRTLVLLAPSWSLGRNETRELLDWTARGGRLVVADAPSAPPTLTVDVSALLRPLGLRTRVGYPKAIDAPEHEAFPRARHVAWPPRLVLDTTTEAGDARAGAIEYVVTVAEHPVAARVPFGEGEVVAVADVALFTNEKLGSTDNAVLAVDLLAGDAAREIVFDEYHHGFTPEGGRGGLVERVAALVVGTWLGRAFLVLVLAGLVHVVGAAVRLGAPLRRPPPARRAYREHADALGRLLENARASREALDVLADGVRRIVASRLGLAPSISHDDLRTRLRRSVAPGAGALADALDAAHASGRTAKTKEMEFARAAANLAAAKRRFLHGSG